MSVSLQDRWSKFSARATIPQRDVLWKNFVALYSEQDRHYHNLDHIEDCLTKLDNWSSHLNGPTRDLIELAIWFHDIIYDTRKADNEEASAALTMHYLRGHSLAVDCHALILATRHKHTEGMRAEEIMCDIDISILGAKPAKFKKYTANIRKEYGWVEEAQYSEARARVITNFLDRDSIFQTPYAVYRWELQARKNLEKERKELFTIA